MPSITMEKAKLGISLIDLLVETSLVSSKSGARRLIEQNGISINNEKVKDINEKITEKDLSNNFITIQKGKKIFLKVIFL